MREIVYSFGLLISIHSSFSCSWVCLTHFAQSSKMGTVTKGFDARLASRPLLVLTFGHSGAQF